MTEKKIKVGIIGCGTIGFQITRAIEQRFSKKAEIFALCDIDESKAQNLKTNISSNPPILSIDKLIKTCDLVVEAASARISFDVAQTALNNSKDVMIMSVGGILGKAEELFALAKSKCRHIFLPSGAIGGLDAIKAASMDKIEKAVLISRKPPQGLRGAPYITEKKIDLSKIKEETVIFEGPASEAVKGFPENVNVCATLSLAGIGMEKTRVKIVTSPEYSANIHEVRVEGDFGKIYTRTENVPSPDNPKTSFLASLSAVATLQNILEPVKIGT